MIDTGESTSALGRVRAAVAGAVELGLKKKAAILAKARSPEIAAIRTMNTEAAIAVDASGVPSFVLDGEPFWGQDRLDLLDHALSTGRPPFKPL